jgi:RNA polymerase sigma factor (TIGR02999 family)
MVNAADDPRRRPTTRKTGQAVTSLLGSIQSGDRQAAADLLPVVYDELRRLARARMAQLPPGQTIQATALVHEVYMKLVGEEDPGWNGRAHFFAAAARAMRSVLVDHVRHRDRLKRGGGHDRITFGAGSMRPVSFDMSCEDALALDAALDRLQREHPRTNEIVMLRQFAGLSHRAIAETLEISRGTVDREWTFALAWLHKEVDGHPRAPGDP